jgi:DNA-binding HxlR family transcriptional regulator
MAKKKEEVHDHKTCMVTIRAVSDALEILNGKWKLPILVSLLTGKKRFKEIAKEVNGITDKMLSKELKDLEVNQLVKRKVFDSFPPAVEYTITPHGKTLQKVIVELRDWGMMHRRKIIGK